MSPVAAPARARPRRHLTPARSARPRLTVVRAPSPRGSHRRALRWLAVITVLALLTVVAFHVLLAQGQVTLDRLERVTEVAERRYQEARLEHAQLAAPERITARAVELGLVFPTEPPTPVAVAGVAPSASEGTSTTLDGWTSVKPSLEPRP